jgi:hypothetical protein
MSDNNDLLQTLAEKNNSDEHWFETTVPLYVFPGDTFCVIVDDEHGNFSLHIYVLKEPVLDPRFYFSPLMVLHLCTGATVVIAPLKVNRIPFWQILHLDQSWRSHFWHKILRCHFLRLKWRRVELQWYWLLV